MFLPSGHHARAALRASRQRSHREDNRCAPDRLSADGSCRSHGWTFETLENLKGTEARVRLLPSDSREVVDTCDVSLKVGDTYVLFLEAARTKLCSGTGVCCGARVRVDYALSEIVAERRYPLFLQSRCEYEYADDELPLS
jgi:hypothetical protein